MRKLSAGSNPICEKLFETGNCLRYGLNVTGVSGSVFNPSIDVPQLIM